MHVRGMNVGVRSHQRRLLLVFGLILAVIAAACGGSSKPSNASQPPNSSSGSAVPGGTATIGLPAGLVPNYIFPIMPTIYYQLQNLGYFTYQLFRPLYYYGVGSTTNLNQAESLADPPVYNSTNTAVTIHLKNWKWSNGQPVTARNIQFWQNLIEAGKSTWAAYTPGEYPDNITKTTIINPETIQFTFNKPYSPSWYTYNELSQITPLPEFVMDKTSVSSPVGNYDLTPSGAKQVFDFLTTQGKDVNTFASNPLWKTVDGAWKLQSFSTTGQTVYVPNPSYSGPNKPTLSKVELLPFTSSTAITNALLSHQLDYSFITISDIPSLPRIKAAGYTTVPTALYGVSGLIPNENNPTYGPLFKQTYFRQALELLVDQQTIISKLLAGNGQVGCGPVPSEPPSPFLSPLEKSCPLSYSISRATQLLTSHGWKVNPGGLSSCQNAGSGPNECGAGVPAGQTAKFTVIYPAGFDLDQQMLLLKTDAAKVGIDYTIQQVPLGTLFTTVAPCQGGSSCQWQIGWYTWVYQPDYLPTGDALFLSGSGSNVANFSDPQADALIKATFHDGSPSTFYKYEDYVSQAAPWIWLPGGKALYQVNSKLTGATPINVFLFLSPDAWKFTK
jgi:peptide/nickel transport system substrate-binding protein